MRWTEQAQNLYNFRSTMMFIKDGGKTNFSLSLPFLPLTPICIQITLFPFPFFLFPFFQAKCISWKIYFHIIYCEICTFISFPITIWFLNWIYGVSSVKLGTNVTLLKLSSCVCTYENFIFGSNWSKSSHNLPKIKSYTPILIN